MPHIVLAEQPDLADRDIIVAGIRGFNESQAGPSHAAPLAVLLKDEAGVTIGGLWGRTSYGWLFIELLVVPEQARGGGFGARMMQAAEAAARARGCGGAWLDTYDFQARPFYERLGYVEFGRLEDYPPGHTRHFMRKAL